MHKKKSRDMTERGKRQQEVDELSWQRRGTDGGGAVDEEVRRDGAESMTTGGSCK